MAIPQEVLAYGWIPFTVVVVLTFIFSWFYIRFYQDHAQSEVSSTLTGILALAITLLTIALVPVDIFLVSYMKNSDGTWKDWSTNGTMRDEFEQTIAVGYYVLYSLVAFFAFILMPFMYFYYEEKDEDATTRQRMCGALKYTIGFLIVAIVLLLVGAFAPLKKPPKNITQWEKKISFLKDELQAHNGETALSLLMGFLSFIGMVIMITYTAYGMTSLPFSMLKGFKNSKKEHLEVSHERESVEERARMIRAKYMDGHPMTGRDRRTLARLEGEEKLLIRRERHLQAANLGWLNKCLKCCRPFEVVFGVLFLLLGLLIIVSLFLTCLDKALNSLGYKYGYVLTKPQLPNPINIVMVYAQKVFPLDYCLFVAIVLYFLYCTMSGIRAISIRCCWIRLYKIRSRKTMPQALLFLVLMLMLTMLFLNIMLFTLAPQYVMYGSQHYRNTTSTAGHSSNTTVHTNGTAPGNSTVTTTFETKVCSTAAPEGACIMTRAAMLLNRFFYKVWFFGACYYWGTWLFLAIYIIGLGVSIAKKRKSVVDEELDSSDDSDEELVNA
ncbi:probable lysosomal cobalamin transporter [Orbicella faveolata]|uniref:probable lysosomal cobalamin transporter n=1 Tax=Orbicella faveolata TaxID=48498 RepID=UPI0009E3DD2A|nr:probable lysosomal cobalamin transporter [Orbicella faveolata]